MSDRTEEAGLSGLLTITIDGHARSLPVLKLRQSREWKARLGSVVADIPVDDGDLASLIARVATAPADVALDLLVAYDHSEVLGGREAIIDQATDPELVEALKTLVTVTFPFEMAARSVVQVLGPQFRVFGMSLMESLAERLSWARSTRTPSATGASTPTPSSSDTPTSSSSSSGPTTSETASETPGSDAT